MQKGYTSSKIFTGFEWLTESIIIVEDGYVEKIVPEKMVDGKIEIKNFGNNVLTPAFIDVQVYGASGQLLSQFPEPATLRAMYHAFIKDGTSLFQPTVSTNTIQVFEKCIDAVKAYRAAGGKGVFGLHLEGPWLNPAKKGAHSEVWIHKPDVKEVEHLLAYGKGVITMITLAPEICDQQIIDIIQANHVIIAAGHSNATYTQAMHAFENGIGAVTHLYNAMSSLQHRAPGLTGAVFNHNNVKASIVADGYHVDFAAISIAKKIMGERLYAITDAVTETNEGPYRHYISGDKYECNGILSGSSLSMLQAFNNLVKMVGIPVDEALRMCSLYPAGVLNADKYGKIMPGCVADFIILDEELELKEVII